jgi:hypothetical protein
MHTDSMTQVCVCVQVRMHVYAHIQHSFYTKILCAQLHGKLVISHVFQ